MAEPIQIRMGGYGPPDTTFSRGLKFIGDRLAAQFGDRVDLKYVWNIMDLAYRTEDLWWLVEHGLLTMAYLSSTGLNDRVPEVGIADLPFLFATEEEARSAVDGPLGRHLAQAMEQRINYRVLGFFENGFRHISNRLHPIRTPADMAGMRIRVLQSPVQERTFELFGALPYKAGLVEAKRALQAGEVDAQENPLANTVTYGMHKLHKFHTLTRHFYISRPIFLHRTSFDAWPSDLQEAMRAAIAEAMTFQRDLAVEEERRCREIIAQAGGEFVEPDAIDKDAFVTAARPLYRETAVQHGAAMARVLGPQCAALLG